MDDDDASYRRDGRPEWRGSELRRSGRDPEPIEQRLDRWMSAGRQFVDGVAGSRPGSRPPTRGAEGRGPGRGGFDGLGRWVEERLDWLLEDGDDWREPWQETESRPQSPPINPSYASSRNASDPWIQADPDDRRNLSHRPNPSNPPQPPAAGSLPRRLSNRLRPLLSRANPGLMMTASACPAGSAQWPPVPAARRSLHRPFSMHPKWVAAPCPAPAAAPAAGPELIPSPARLGWGSLPAELDEQPRSGGFPHGD